MTCYTQPLGPSASVFLCVKLYHPEAVFGSWEPKVRSWPLSSSQQAAGGMGISFSSCASHPHPDSLAALRRVMMMAASPIPHPPRGPPHEGSVITPELSSPGGSCQDKPISAMSLSPLCHEILVFYLKILSVPMRDVRIVQAE